MKNLLFLAGLAIFAFSCTQSNKYSITGQIKDGKGQWLYLEKMDLKQHKAIDSIKLDEKGSFKFVAERLLEPTFFSLKLNNDNFVTLLADSTEKILVNASAKNLEESYTVERSLGSGYIKILNRKLRVTKQATDSLVKVYAALGESDWIQKKQVENEYLTIIEAHKKFIGNFVMENPRSFASYYALLLELNDAPIMNVMDKKDQIFFSTVATSLNVTYPESDRVKHLYSFVLSARNIQRRSEITQQLMANAQVGLPNIEAPTPKGINVNLKSLKGNVVLLSFWASFDQNSRRENRNLKRVYDKYKSRGFEIFQFSLDQSRVLWESALEKDGVEWISVSDLKSSESPCISAYNVTSIPSNYLISRDGEIIGKDLFGARLEEKLAELLR